VRRVYDALSHPNKRQAFVIFVVLMGAKIVDALSHSLLNRS